MAIRFTEMLSVACEALHDALATLGCPGREPGRLMQIGDLEFQFDTVAAAHFAAASVRRIVIGCSEAAMMSPATAVGEAVAFPADGVLVRLGVAYGQALAARLPELGAEDRSFLVHDAGRFRVRAVGARNFHYHLPLILGSVDLVLDLESRRHRARDFRPERGLLPDASIDPEADGALVRSDVVRAIFAHLAFQEADVRIKVNAGRSRFDFVPATVLDAGEESDLCVITAAAVSGRPHENLAGESIDLVFPLQGKLLEGRCRVEAVAQGVLGDGLEIPLLRLQLPDRLTYGQRRGASRIVPRDRIQGSLRRLDLEERPVGSPLPFRVLDLSSTGLRAALAGSALLSGLKWGTPLICELDLPQAQQPLRLNCVVRRLLLPPDPGGRRGAILGVEFQRGPSPGAIKTLRRYLAAYPAGDSPDAVELEEVAAESTAPASC